MEGISYGVVGGSMHRCCFWCSCALIFQHATTFSHSHLLNIHCNRFFNVYNSHLACRISSSWTVATPSSQPVVSYRKVCRLHICNIIKMPQLLQQFLLLLLHSLPIRLLTMLHFELMHSPLSVYNKHNRIPIYRLYFANSLWNSHSFHKNLSFASFVQILHFV